MATNFMNKWNGWYPVYSEELNQSIHDCDVEMVYQGVIRNDFLGLTEELENIQQAEAECKRRNFLIAYVEVL